MKVFVNEHQFKYSWRNITLAYFNKYPNKFSQHVKEIDCYDRQLVDNLLIIRRILTFEIKLPWIIENLKSYFLPDYNSGYIHETITIDPVNRSMQTVSRSLITNNYLSVVEKSSYVKDEDNTVYNQRICINTPYKIVEEFVYKLLSNKSNTGIQALDEIASRLL